MPKRGPTMKPLLPDPPQSPSPSFPSIPTLAPHHSLILLRVPKHPALRASLVDKTLDLTPGAAPSVVRGNYHFIDRGLTDAASSLRVGVVGDDDGGGGDDGDEGRRFVIGPRFMRQVDVCFVGAPTVLTSARRVKEYPRKVEGLGVVFKHAGVRKKGEVGKVAGKTGAVKGMEKREETVVADEDAMDVGKVGEAEELGGARLKREENEEKKDTGGGDESSVEGRGSAREAKEEDEIVDEDAMDTDSDGRVGNVEKVGAVAGNAEAEDEEEVDVDGDESGDASDAHAEALAAVKRREEQAAAKAVLKAAAKAAAKANAKKVETAAEKHQRRRIKKEKKERKMRKNTQA